MIKLLYCIRDKKAAIYNTPVVFDNDAVAIRAFGDLIQGDKNSIVSLHPSDFSLCFIGTFDAETGLLNPEPIRVLADGDNFVTKV